MSLTIHYRPLANRRVYESIALPLGPGPERAALRATAKPISFRPDPFGDAVARNAARAFDVRPIDRDCAYDPPKNDAEFRDRLRGLRAPTTREIPIAVDATLPAIAAALDKLGEDLRDLGLGGHAVRVRAIALAVETVRAHALQWSVGYSNEHDYWTIVGVDDD